MSNYANVLEMLLRLRQMCDHPALLPSGYLSRPGAPGISPISPEVRKRLLEMVETRTRSPPSLFFFCLQGWGG